MRRIVGIVVVVVILGAGFFVVRPFLEGYLGARAVKVPPAPVEVNNPPTVTPPVGETKVGETKAGETKTGEGKGTVEGSGNQATTGNQTGNQPSGKQEATGQQTKPSAKTNGESPIDVYYRDKLAQIGSYYQGKLNGLVSQAYQSYLAVKEGKSKTSLATLAGQYISEGDTLEEESDKQFFAVWDQYRDALAKAGLPTTYLEQARQEYINAKVAERNKILAAARQYMQ